jgi:GNAT superfamily N-acetyltransferase
MIELEITKTVPRKFGSEHYGSVIHGIMKEDGITRGKFLLNTPNQDVDRNGASWIVIWEFEIFPEFRGKGYGKAGYLALEKMILDKYNPHEIYLTARSLEVGSPNPKGFWEKLGYATTHDQDMKKRFAEPLRNHFH